MIKLKTKDELAAYSLGVIDGFWQGIFTGILCSAFVTGITYLIMAIQ